ncbi:unnamed protein product [Rhizophagus irregularis]|nr:unnamed protein product [Rhizophagus irregularis]
MVQRNGVPINLNFYTIITTPIKKELKKWLKGCKTLRDSIKDYIQEETLDRDNNILLASSIVTRLGAMEYFCRKILEGL